MTTPDPTTAHPARGHRPDPDSHRGEVRAYPVVNAPQAGVFANGGARLIGWSLLNSGAAAEVVTILDGNNAQGQPLAVVALPAGLSDTKWLAPHGIDTQIGLFASSGADVTGALFYVAASGRD